WIPRVLDGQGRWRRRSCSRQQRSHTTTANRQGLRKRSKQDCVSFLLQSFVRGRYGRFVCGGVAHEVKSAAMYPLVHRAVVHRRLVTQVLRDEVIEGRLHSRPAVGDDGFIRYNAGPLKGRI